MTLLLLAALALACGVALALSRRLQVERKRHAGQAMVLALAQEWGAALAADLREERRVSAAWRAAAKRATAWDVVVVGCPEVGDAVSVSPHEPQADPDAVTPETGAVR
mgnify:CR=1 FL=1